MSDKHFATRHGSCARLVWLAAISVIGLAGCGHEDQIRTYRAPKDPADAPARQAPATDRLLGAIVPRGKEAWFFKLSGPISEVAAQVGRFDAFLKTVTFAGDEPQWTLPAGWKQLPGSGFRYATLEISTEPTETADTAQAEAAQLATKPPAGARKPLELTVTKLPWEEKDGQAAMLSNINRWRAQLSVPPFELAELKRETTEVQVAGATALVVDFEGRPVVGEGMGRPPFAGGGAGPAEPPAERGAAPRGTQPPLEFTSTTPAGWTKGAASQFTKAAFDVAQGTKKIKITVSTAGGSLVANVNRWRDQVGLGERTAEQLQQDGKKLRVGQSTGDYFELVGPAGQTTLGVIVPAAGQQWFIKLTGDSELAAREKERFEEFVQSIRFGG